MDTCLAVLALGVWAPDPSAALGYAIGTHGVNVLVNVILGGACMVREGVGLGLLARAHR